MKREQFDPSRVSKEEMKNLADGFESFLDVREELIIYPDDMSKKDIEEYEEAKERVRELIKKLRKGKKSAIFNDYDEFNSVY